jgi:hypothetical protein
MKMKIPEMLSRIRTRTIVFAVTVPLIAASSLISSPCPVCNGKGTLATTPGMQNVEIYEYDADEWRITRDACGLYILYFYDIDITLYNSGLDEVSGWLKLTLEDISKPAPYPLVDTQYRQVTINGRSVVDLKYTVVFGTGIDAYGTTGVRIEILTGDVPDITCKGTGRVPSNTWLFVNGLKDRFSDTVQSELQYRPPEAIDWDDYTYFDE